MALNGTPLLADVGLQLVTEAGTTIYVNDLPATDAGVGSKGKGHNLWALFQEEMALRHTPPPRKPEPEPEEDEIEDEPAPFGGFFVEPTSQEHVLAQLRARVEAQELQKKRNAKAVSDLLRKLSRR